MNTDEQSIALATGVGVSNTLMIGNAFLPSLASARTTTAADSTFVTQLRTAEASTAALSLTVSAIASALCSSALPLVVSSIVLVAQFAVFEYVLHHSSFEPLAAQPPISKAA